MPVLRHGKQEDQLDLLCRVLTAGLEEAGVERGANDDEDDALLAERRVRMFCFEL